MFNTITKGIQKLFGNKSERDIKGVQSVVAEINAEYAKLSGLTNDQLRNRSNEFREHIAQSLADIDDKTGALRKEAEAEPDPDKQQEIFKQIDALGKDRDEKLEEILEGILPQAFAVMKETARRFTENTELTVSPTERDKDLMGSGKIDFLENRGSDTAVFKNSWDAAGSQISWSMIHYDVQLIGGIMLHRGKVAEMATGEGKTLVSTLPAYLNALSGQGVHIVTVNDYLARRDCEWMRPVYEFLQVQVDCIEYHSPHSDGRKAAYKADITYGTNNEFGFDYLRDNMSREPEDMVQKKFHYAMVDEVDSVLIDDARTPLIISGPTSKSDQDHEKFYELKPRVERLIKAQKDYAQRALIDAKKLYKDGAEKEAGLALMRAYRGLPKNKALIKFLSEPGVKAFLQKTENFYLQDQSKEMPTVDKELYFVIEEKSNSVNLTEKGIDLITKSGEEKDFFILPDIGSEMAQIEGKDIEDSEKVRLKDEMLRDFSVKSERIHTISQLLKAYTMFEKDVEYIISEDGKIKIVDEQTGRVMEGRRYSDGLHQAIEAKESVKVEGSTQTFATVTLQNFFRMYHKLAGMTGTAETEAGELWEIYKLDVVVIPTNKPILRKDQEDKVYKTTREKYNAVIEEIEALVNNGQPVLVGTTSVEISEKLARMLQIRKIKHNVLNAKQHQREADIVAEAGLAGTVTIATNMAGRGTDIKLGPGVKEAGGLAIIGTERHDSRRVDRQLRGRAGRQGDPGSSQFYVSLEDKLMRLFGSERIAKYMDKMGLKEGEVIVSTLITKSIERAQKKVEQNNFGVRKRLLEYDDVMNKQRTAIYALRKNALFGERLKVDLNNMVYDLGLKIVEQYKPANDYESFSLEIMKVFAVESHISAEDFETKGMEELVEELYQSLGEAYRRKSAAIASQAFPVLQGLHQDRGDKIKNVVIPFTDGYKSLQVVANLEKSVATEGQQVINSFEKFVTLALIDDLWKEHLREMDDLKQSVQNASYEQKDPLVIYKAESFNLFQGLLDRVYREILSLLFKGKIEVSQSDSVSEARQPVKTRKPEYQAGRSDVSQQQAQQRAAAAAANTEPQKKEPVRADNLPGRNEPCHCGSGKKFKNCHGKPA